MIKPTGMKVLLTGDSHMEWSPFGRELEKLLTAAGAKVTRRAIGGSAAFQWAGPGPVCRTISGEKKCLSIDDLNADGPYDLVVISLGTNDAANAGVIAGTATWLEYGRLPAEQQRKLDGSISGAVADLQKFAKKLKAARVIYVGPPTMSDKRALPASADKSLGYYTNDNMAAFYRLARPVLGSALIDSRPANKSRQDGDGVHVGPKDGARWAKYVFERLEGESASVWPYVAGTLAALAVIGGVIYWKRRR